MRFVITAFAATALWAIALSLAFAGDGMAIWFGLVGASLTLAAGLISEGERVFS